MNVGGVGEYWKGLLATLSMVKNDVCENSRDGIMELPETSRKILICSLSSGEPQYDAFRMCESRLGVFIALICVGVGDAEIRFSRMCSTVWTCPKECRFDAAAFFASLAAKMFVEVRSREAPCLYSISPSPSPTGGFPWPKIIIDLARGRFAWSRIELAVVPTLDTETNEAAEPRWFFLP